MKEYRFPVRRRTLDVVFEWKDYSPTYRRLRNSIGRTNHSQSPFHHTMPSTSRVAIVTGGNSGIGKGLTVSLISRGWNVAVADINEDTHFAKELGDSASFYRCNIADYDR